MKPTARQRWIAYAVAALATVVAMWGVNQRAADSDDVVVAVARPQPAMAEASAPATSDARSPGKSMLRSIPAEARHGDAPVTDPFGAPEWERRAALRAATPPPAPVRPPPPTAPPVPFVYMGRWIEDGASMAILDRDGQPSFVHLHDTVDGSYRVESIDETRLVLTYLPMHLRQVVSAGGEAASAPRAAMAATPAPVEGGSGSSGSADSSD